MVSEMTGVDSEHVAIAFAVTRRNKLILVLHVEKIEYIFQSLMDSRGDSHSSLFRSHFAAVPVRPWRIARTLSTITASIPSLTCS